MKALIPNRWSPRLRDVRSRLEPIWVATGNCMARPAVLHAIALASVCLLLSMQNGALAKYVNQYMFYEPVSTYKTRLGNGPLLDPRIRLVVADESTLSRLKRLPTMNEWLNLATRLGERGVERILFYGGGSFAYEERQPFSAMQSALPALIATAVDIPKNYLHPGKLELDGTLTSFLIENHSKNLENIAETTAIQALPINLLENFSSVGHMNQDSAVSVTAAYHFRENHLLPYLGLQAASSLTSSNDGLFANGRKVPLNADGEVLVNYVTLAEMGQKALPYFYFNDKAGAPLDEETFDRRWRRMEGAKTVIFVVDGTQQGARFVDSPAEGVSVPQYMTLLSVVNSTITGRFIAEPLSPGTLLILSAICFYGLTFIKRAWLSLVTLIGLIFATQAGAVIALISYDVNGAAAPVLLVGGVAFMSRFAVHFVTTVGERAKLHEQLELGSAVQSLLMPANLSGSVGRFTFHVTYKPFGPMAGDWYQVFAAENVPGIGPCAIVAIGDVVGKGPSAALNTAVIAQVWQSHVEEWQAGSIDLDRFFEALNGAIYRTFRGKQNTTLSLAYLRSDKVTVISASAPRWIVVEKDGEGKRVRTRPHDPVGLFAATNTAPSKEITVDGSQVFVAYTDGVIDQSSAETEFRKYLQSIDVNGDAPKLFAAIEDNAVRIGKDSALPDDLTMLMIHYDAQTVQRERQDELPAAAPELSA